MAAKASLSFARACHDAAGHGYGGCRGLLDLVLWKSSMGWIAL